MTSQEPTTVSAVSNAMQLQQSGKHTILDFEVGELGIEPELLNDTRILARSKLGVILRLGTRHHHLARSEDECGGLRLANTHDHGRETLWIVLGISSVQRDGLEIKLNKRISKW